MHLRHRRRALGIVAVTAASFALSTLPASAVAPPAWPSAGRIPSGCTLTGIASGANPGDVNAIYTDGLTPTVTKWDINGSTSTVIMPVGGATLKVNVYASEPCSGVGGISPIVSLRLLAGPVATGLSAVPNSTDAFNAKHTATLLSLNTTYAGRWQVPFALAVHRYDSMVLDQDFKLVSSTPGTGAGYQSGAWSKQAVYVLLKTTATSTASKTSVAKGGSVIFKATLKKAGETAYVAAAGAKVLFQTKSPGDTWVTRSTLTATSGGLVSTTFKPARTMLWRFVHAGDKSVAYTAPVTTVAKTIKVT